MRGRGRVRERKQRGVQNAVCLSVVAGGHLLLEVPYERHSQLGPVVPSQRVGHDLGLDTRLHLRGAHSAQTRQPLTRSPDSARARERTREKVATRREHDTHHLQGAADDAFEDLGVDQAAGEGLFGELDKVGEGVVVKDEAEGGLGLGGRRGRVLDQGRGDGEEGTEGDLCG